MERRQSSRRRDDGEDDETMRRWNEGSLLGIEAMWNMDFDFWIVEKCNIGKGKGKRHVGEGIRRKGDVAREKEEEGKCQLDGEGERGGEGNGNGLEMVVDEQEKDDQNEDVKVVALSNAPQTLKLTSPDIQKDIINMATFETINLIEHFLGIEHVANTNALSLKQAEENLFSRLGLSISKLRGQGYDRASNMQSEFNGLKTLILKENPCAYYVHCFAHQLQLILVAVTKNYNQIALLFTLVSNVVNVVRASCKRRDIVREKQVAKVAEALNIGELSSRQGLNQETNLKHASNTRWGSHYSTLVNLASMFSTVIDVPEMISEDGSNSEQ
ncbi:zinc finger MYM-type protein 1-like [Camellia sinensis]|uniref:zinc finger MYM-type protein 1-like n=1 Tax=Camellia sinensis TaxID=4442 RepID=UPI001036292D|nr:zinc finger MYM-type protein 1-like [Camellia sinensis]